MMGHRIFSPRWEMIVGVEPDPHSPGVIVYGAVDREARTVAIPERVIHRITHSQAGKDWSASVCNRLAVAALRHPHLVGCSVIERKPL